jgi:protease-4
VPVPGRSIAGNDESSAVATNPANVAFLPAWEARFTWVRTGASSPDPGRGQAFDLGLRLPFQLATGLRFDLVRPPEAAPPPFDEPYTWLTWALAVRFGPGIAFGGSVRHVYSDSPLLDDLTAFTAAASYRPSPYLGLSVVARDFNSPRTIAGAYLDRSFDLAAAVRPTGRRDLEIGLEDLYLSDSGQWLPRITLGIQLPYLGTLRAGATFSDPTAGGRFVYAASAGIELGYHQASAEAGGVFGTAIDAGFYLGASIGGYRPPGIPEPSYAQSVRINDTPGAREHVRLLRELWSLAADRSLAALVLVIRSEPADSLAHAEELGDALRLLRANGKKVLCHLVEPEGRSLFVCAQADRILLDPAGDVRFAGLHAQYQYYKDLLDKIGVQAQFVRIGDHKTYPEQFTRSGPSRVADEDHRDLLHEFDEVWNADVGGGRHLSVPQLKRIFTNGPLTAAEALNARIVDELMFEDQIDDAVDALVGKHVSLRRDPLPPPAPARFGIRPRVALVYIEGDMVEGESREIPVLGMRTVGARTIVDVLKEVREDPYVAAVVLRIESPGGASIAADAMWREAALLAAAKPLVVSMGSYAASGGYYVAVAGRTVFANPLTVTGSIGIFYGRADVAELAKKIGLSVVQYKTLPHADAASIFRPLTPEELSLLQDKIRQSYDIFLSRVAQGRHLTTAEVDAVGQGRVWTGRQAKVRGLVDRLGGLREALIFARRAADLPEDAPISELPVPPFSWLSVARELATAAGASTAGTEVTLPPEALSILRELSPFFVYSRGEPLARISIVPSREP